MNAFHAGTADLERVNKAYLALLPKKAASLLAKDYRPISLQNCVTKICTKGMTLRLQPFIPHLVHSDQTGFIKGRCIAENFIYATEVVQCCHKRGASAIILKLDFRKAFDSVDWHALDAILLAKGFPARWRTWITNLNTSSQTAVVLNGVPGKWIQCRKGLRQGDPLSPYLFILVADLLQQMVLSASMQGLLQHPIVDSLPCPVLQYADDTLLVVKADPDQLAHLKALLDQFSSFTGLHINYDKSTFVPIGVEPSLAAEMAQLFGCQVSSFPQTYLGLPLNSTKLRLADHRPLVAAVESYIPGWCGKLLSPSGRTVLANAVLGARAVYAMCSTLLHKGTIEAIDARRRAFIWTGDITCSGGQCKAAWELVCWDRARGGLGIKRLDLQNKGLLSKFVDKLLQAPTTNWQKWFHLMYGDGAGRDLGDTHHLDTAIWTTLRQLIPNFRRCTKVHLGSGQFTSFWFDHWIGPQPLADLFPALLSFCPRPNITVAHAYLQDQWIIPLHPRLTSVASSQLSEILLALADVALLPHVPDRRGIGVDLQPFSSRGFYLWHMEQRLIDGFADCIWSNAAIPRCKHFLWLVHHNRLPSAALLHHRCIVESALCQYCGAYEDQDHLLLRCPLARGLLNYIGWNIAPHLTSFRELWDLPYFSDEASPRTRSTIITAVLWNVWKARNSVVFSSLFPTAADTRLAILQDLRLWSIRMRSPSDKAYLHEWCSTFDVN